MFNKSDFLCFIFGGIISPLTGCSSWFPAEQNSLISSGKTINFLREIE